MPPITSPPTMFLPGLRLTFQYAKPPSTQAFCVLLKRLLYMRSPLEPLMKRPHMLLFDIMLPVIRVPES